MKSGVSVFFKMNCLTIVHNGGAECSVNERTENGEGRLYSNWKHNHKLRVNEHKFIFSHFYIHPPKPNYIVVVVGNNINAENEVFESSGWMANLICFFFTTEK